MDIANGRDRFQSLATDCHQSRLGGGIKGAGPFLDETGKGLVDEDAAARAIGWRAEVVEPLNVGSNELVTINGLVDVVEDIAGVRLERDYQLDAPKGVNGRNSDNTRILQHFGWEPSTSLADGMV